MSGIPLCAVMIWGHRDCAPPTDARILWSQNATGSDQVSLPDAIHSNRLYWTSEYARWLSGVGASYSVSGAAREFTVRNDGLSYWWMTFPTEFTFSRDCLAYKVLRLMALADTIRVLEPSKVRTSGLPRDARDVIESWCLEQGIEVEHVEGVPHCQCDPEESRKVGGHGEAVRHIWSQFVRYGLKKNRNSTADRLIVDYFDNVRPDADVYSSNYWVGLVELLNELPGATRWSHIDVRSASLPRAADARSYARRLTSQGTSTHQLVQDRISLALIRRSLSTLRRIERIGRQSWTDVSFVDDSRGMDLRPVARDPWRSHHGGVTAAANALSIHLMDKTVEGIAGPALYLMENQPWEMALLHAWRRRSKHGISGWIHSRARAWDLRYALPLLSGEGDVNLRAPSPDECLVGSAREARILEQDGYPAESVTEVEAVRFALATGEHEVLARPQGATRMLVLGEYDEASNLLLVESIRRADLEGILVTYRPHPSRQVGQVDLPAQVEISRDESVVHALMGCDIVLAMSTSTSVLTAVNCRIPVIVLQDPAVLDGSGLGKEAVARILPNTRVDLELIQGALRDAASREWTVVAQHRHADLPRWRRWLKSWS